MNQISLAAVAESHSDATATMTSLEIESLTGSRHDSVKRTIERLAESGVISLPPTVEVKVQRERRAESVEVYVFAGPQGRLDSITVVAQLDPAFTAALVKRWDALETGKAKPEVAQNEARQQIDKPDPQAFAVVQSAWVDAVERKIASKREALQFLRDASAVMIHGVDVLQRAAKASNPAKALPAPTQATLTNGESVPYGFRAAGTKSATDLLRDHGVSAQAKALYDAMEKQNMVTTRYDLTVDQPGCRVLIGEGLQYGQNVMLFESVRSNPYFYHDKFGALLKRVGLLVDATPKPTASERALRDYKNIVKDAWITYGCETSESANRDGIHIQYLTRSALIQYLTIELGKPEKTAQNFAAPRSDAMRALFKDGFLSKHKNGWLIFDGYSI